MSHSLTVTRHSWERRKFFRLHFRPASPPALIRITSHILAGVRDLATQQPLPPVPSLFTTSVPSFCLNSISRTQFRCPRALPPPPPTAAAAGRNSSRLVRCMGERATTGEQQGPREGGGGEGHLDSRQAVSYSLALSPREGESCATRTRTLDKGKAFPCVRAWPSVVWGHGRDS